MKNILFVLIAVLTFNLATYAQVGIGQTPDPGSILDLTNSSNKYLVLPVANTDPNVILGDSATLFFYHGNIYLKTKTGIKVFTPWEWDGSSTGAIYSSAGTYVGIGVVPSSSDYHLQVADAGEITANSNSPAAIVVGDVNGNPSCPHLMIDQDEIMAKSNATNGGTLKLQEDDGTVEIRMSSSTTVNTVLTANGSINAAGSGSIKENGFDLVPSGTVVMWYGSWDASGYPLMAGVANTNWHICDGNAGTPDLRERFVVGAGGNNPTVTGLGYSVNDNGGANSVALTTTELPAHNHPASCSTDGTHSHKTGSIPNGGEGYAALYNGSNEVYKYGYTTDIISTDNGSHSHTVTVSDSGGGSAHENRPPYFALAYIMKL